MKTTKKQQAYNIDYINETITVTKKFLKAASVYNSPEYKLMKEIRADYPTFKFAEKEIAKKAGTKSTEKEIYHDEPDERFPDDYCRPHR